MANDTAKKLLALKDEIDAAKTEKAQIEGSLNATMERLKEDFSVTSLEAAEKALAKLERLDGQLETELEEIVEDLEKKYDW